MTASLAQYFGGKGKIWQHWTTVATHWFSTSCTFCAGPGLQLLKIEQDPETDCVNPMGLETEGYPGMAAYPTFGPS